LKTNDTGGRNWGIDQPVESIVAAHAELSVSKED